MACGGNHGSFLVFPYGASLDHRGLENASVGAATAARDANKGVVYEPGCEVNNSPVIIEF